MVVIGQAILMIVGQIDLSVGSTVSLAGVGAALLVSGTGIPWFLALVAAIAIGLGVGAVNALLVVVARLPSLIVTLGTLYAAAGLALVASGGQQVSDLPDELTAAGRFEIFGLPVSVVLLIALTVIVQLVLSYSLFGRHAYAIGGSPRGAVRAGVPVRRYTTYAFLLSGALAGLAGVLLAARVGVAIPIQGQGQELIVITAAVVGGISLFGGIGSVAGAVLGVIFVQVVNIGLVVAGVSSRWQLVATGFLLILAVALDAGRRRINLNFVGAKK